MKLLLKFFFSLLFLTFIFEVSASAACGAGTTLITIYCITSNDTCDHTSIGEGYGVHFYTLDNTEDFTLYTDSDGKISHCFTLYQPGTSIGQRYHIEGTD